MTNQLSRVDYSTIDYLNNTIIQAYFEVKEAESYYSSFRTVNESRNFSTKFIRCANSFLDVISDNAIELLNTSVFSKIDTEQPSSKLRAPGLEEFKMASERGFELLDLKIPITFSSLKSSYKNAAFKYHPDRGGTTENMQIINDAYPKFHDILCTYGSINKTTSTPRKMKVQEYVKEIAFLNLHACIDLWDIELAFNLFQQYLSEGWFFLENSEFIDLDVYFSQSSRFFGSFSIVTQLAKCLTILNKYDDAKEIFNLIIAATQGFKNRSFHPTDLEQRNKQLNLLEGYVNLNKTFNFTINHSLQLKNILKAECLSPSKIGSIKKLINAIKNEEQKQTLILQTYLQKACFLNLKIDNIELPPPIVERMYIEHPHTGYVEELNFKQFNEYTKTFYTSANLYLLRKYEVVRLTSLLRSYILHTNDYDFEQICNEFRLIQQLQPTKANRKGTARWCDEAINFIQSMQRQHKKNFNRRLNLLRELEEISIWMLNKDKEEGYPHGKAYIAILFPFRISAQKWYYSEARMPLKKLFNKVQAMRAYRYDELKLKEK